MNKFILFVYLLLTSSFALSDSPIMCEKKSFEINYEHLGYSKVGDIYIHKNCYPNYPRSPRRNYLVNHNAAGLMQRLDFCLSSEDKEVISRDITLNKSKPVLINCQEKGIENVYYIDPTQLTMKNVNKNASQFFQTFLSKYDLKYKPDELKHQISKMCYDCCFNASSEGKGCSKCFQAGVRPKISNNPSNRLKQSFINLRKSLTAIVKNKGQCNTSCQETIINNLSIYPDAQALYLSKIGREIDNNLITKNHLSPFRALTVDEKKYLSEKYKENLADIKNKMLQQGINSPDEIQRAQNVFLLNEIDKDPYVTLREKYSEEVVLLHANLVLVDNKTPQEADAAVDEFLKEKFINEAPKPTNDSVKQIKTEITNKHAMALVEHINALSEPDTNWEQLRTTLDSTYLDVCQRPKNNVQKASNGLILSIRKYMAKKVYNGMVEKNKRSSPMGINDTDYVQELTKYIRMWKTGC